MKVTIRVKDHQVHFNVVGLKGNFVICACFAKKGANCVLDISKQYWNKCAQVARHIDPLKGHKKGQKVTWCIQI